jgi:hypothetical protein
MAQTDSQFPPGFKEIVEGNTRLVVRSDMAQAVCEALKPLRGAWSCIAQGSFTSRGRAGIVSIALGRGLPTMMVRRYVHGGLCARISRSLYLGRARALIELAVSEAARSGGVRTSEAIGALAVHVWGPFWRLALMTLEISDSEDLIHYCCRVNDYPPETEATEKRGVICEAAREIRRMHDIGIRHADLHLKNLLLRRRAIGTPEVYVIDFDNATIGTPLTAPQRLSNLKRLVRSVRKVRIADAVLTEWDKVRFLRTYLDDDPKAAAHLRTWAKKLARISKARQVWWAATRARRHFSGNSIGKIR